MNKHKIINDPVHGFMSLRYEILYDLIHHPFFQRLRRILQLGLTSYVYPGAQHTRFSHALGATHLMSTALDVLKLKQVDISDAECEAVLIAILLHDLGHGPFSHALEHNVVNVHHEQISLLMMQQLNRSMDGKLTLAIQIFTNQYHKHFLHQLVSSQLDMDRLDYLSRDSFFTGVHEGIIGYNRIIKMLNVVDNHLVVEEKGVYSIERFLISRRLMYWQVYLHRVVLGAELMVVKLFQRAKYLVQNGTVLKASYNLEYFLMNVVTEEMFENEDIMYRFAELDDSDIFATLKIWKHHSDTVLSYLSKGILERKILTTVLSKKKSSLPNYKEMLAKVMTHFKIDEIAAKHLVFQSSTSNNAYNRNAESIKISMKDGSVHDIVEVSDLLNIKQLTQPDVKYYLSYPREIDQ